MTTNHASNQTIEQLLRRPWSRLLVPDDGVIAASVPELRGCFAEGSTMAEAVSNLDDALALWLSAAIETGAEIPQPQGEAEPETYSGRFSLRLPRSLHRRLAARAENEGCSLNQLLATLLAEAVGGDGTKESSGNEDARDDITADAVAAGADSIGALKGIATFLRNRGDINLACLVYAFASERVAAGPGGAQEAAKEFGTAASLAKRERRLRLAESLWRQSLRRDFTNIRSRSGLGQLLHHQGRYEEAIEYLQPVASVDEYAQMFLGWSRLQLGLASTPSQDDMVEEGLADVVAALRRWCAYAPREDRSSWLRQLRRLSLLGPRFREEVNQLVSFANSNANWPKISPNDIEDVSRHEHEDQEAPAEIATAERDA